MKITKNWWKLAQASTESDSESDSELMGLLKKIKEMSEQAFSDCHNASKENETINANNGLQTEYFNLISETESAVGGIAIGCILPDVELSKNASGELDYGSLRCGLLSMINTHACHAIDLLETGHSVQVGKENRATTLANVAIKNLKTILDLIDHPSPENEKYYPTN